MHSKFTRFIICCLVIVFTFILTANSQPVKTVLLEQHTGSWCGWCVDGSYIMDQILEQYPGQVIGVKIHNGDSMAIAEQTTLSSTLGVTFYPSATVDRKYFNDSICFGRGSWKTHCAASLLDNPKVEVSLSYVINENTRELEAKISAKMLTTVFDDIRFNVYIVEDSVSGTGTGWDQSNYLSNRAGYEENPYYKLPAKIVGYQHMKVVRKMLGDVWGEKGEFATPALNGETYSHTFLYTLDPRWKIKDIHLVGIVQVYTTSNKQILNACYGIPGVPMFELSSNQPEVKKVVPLGSSFDKLYSIKNTSDANLTYVITSDKSERTPLDWSVDVSSTTSVGGKTKINANSLELTVPPQQSSDFVVKLIPGATKGFGDADILIEVKDNPEAMKSVRNFTAISAEIENFQVLSKTESQYSLSSIIRNMGHDDFHEFVPEDFNEFINDFPNKRVVVWNSGADYVPTPTDVSNILTAIGSNVPMVLFGNRMVSGLSSDNSLGYFGVEYNGWSTQGYGTAPWRVWLSGVENDPISGNFGLNTEGNLIHWLISLLKVTNWQIAHPVLHLANDGKHVVRNGNVNDTVDISGENAVFAVRVVNNGSLSFLSSISPFVVKDAVRRNNLVDNSIKWVLGLLDVDDEFTYNKDFSMEITPNPVESSAMIMYSFGGTHAQNLKFILFDNLGNQVFVLNNVNVMPGEYQLPLNTENLSAGSYRLAGYSGGNVISIPVVITR